MKELELLAHIFKGNKELPAHVTIPPGDDMGGILFNGQLLLVTTDQIVDTVHVNLQNTPLDLIARKAINKNISDVAAMAAKPIAAVATACLPKSMSTSQSNELFNAMQQYANQYDCPLIGGDISIWDHPMLLTVTIFAEQFGKPPVLRSTAKPGDVVYVTGKLGGSWSADGKGRHLTFSPRLEVAQQLNNHPEIKLTSLIDLSDGLATDLNHICKLSHVKAILNENDIPVADNLVQERAVAVQHALSDGEDYELCFSVDKSSMVPDSINDIMITKVGYFLTDEEIGTYDELLCGDKHNIVLQNGKNIKALNLSGWEHQ